MSSVVPGRSILRKVEAPPSSTTTVMATPPIQHEARAENPSEVAALNGGRAKTPIIAGAVSGACVLLAWTIGFILFFMRRRRQRQRAREAGFKSHRDIIDFIPIPNPTTFIIPPDPALVGPPKSYENHIRDLEERGQLEKSPASQTPLRALDQRESETVPSPGESLRTNSTTNSTPMITTVAPSTLDMSTDESGHPMLDPPTRLPPAPLTRKTLTGRER